MEASKTKEKKKESKQDLALINVDDLSLVDNNALNEKQLNQILSRTPKRYVQQRPAKGGGMWDYVTVGYITKVLNLMFGWDWDFEIVKDNMDMVLMGSADEVIVLGKLTCKSNGRTIVKTQYGNCDVKMKKGGGFLSVGNDLKGAASDALKKCASQIGIAADIYNKKEFREVKVDLSDKKEEELKRAIDWIASSKSIKELNKVAEYVTENATPENGLRKLFDQKEKELS